MLFKALSHLAVAKLHSVTSLTDYPKHTRFASLAT